VNLVKFTFSIVYNDELHHNIDTDDNTKLRVQECAEQMTVEEDSLEEAVYSIRDTLALDNKTLKSCQLKNIEI
jgi:hypothetical protein